MRRLVYILIILALEKRDCGRSILLHKLHMSIAEYPFFKVEQNLVESTQNASARNRKRQPKDLETYRLESARSLHTEPTHSRAKETAEMA
jgi:hypothetical protein